MKRRRGIAGLLIAASLAGSGVAVSAAPGHAAECRGSNDFVVEGDASGAIYETVTADSCKSVELVNKLGDVKDAAGLTGLMTTKWPQAGPVAGVVFTWAWFNQARVRDCVAGGTGVAITLVNGLAVACRAQ